jgi:hypothetical protein
MIVDGLQTVFISGVVRYELNHEGEGQVTLSTDMVTANVNSQSALPILRR